MSKKGTHDYQDDPRNADIIIDINGEYFARNEAKVSVFDSGFVLGDGVWEGLRVHQGKIAFLDQHLDRLYEGAKALDMEMEIAAPELGERLYRLLEKNDMSDGVHIRLMVSRGIKATPYQDPRITITPPTIVVIPEYKQAMPETATKGIRLFTVHVRRGYPDVQDPKLNSEPGFEKLPDFWLVKGIYSRKILQAAFTKDEFTFYAANNRPYSNSQPGPVLFWFQ